ncbi:4a-hydroxytetrahydrobiopterin dehydratase [bacterium]|nr:4a-hydroxytetrahydrobiopterin dehydratase [bacterium]
MQAKLLTPQVVKEALSELPGWIIVEGHRLEKKFSFPDFSSALAFVNTVAETAEHMQHHPEIHLAWGKVKIQIWTHSAGGITQKDLDFAAKLQPRQKLD